MESVFFELPTPDVTGAAVSKDRVAAGTVNQRYRLSEKRVLTFLCLTPPSVGQSGVIQVICFAG